MPSLEIFEKVMTQASKCHQPKVTISLETAASLMNAISLKNAIAVKNRDVRSLEPRKVHQLGGGIVIRPIALLVLCLFLQSCESGIAPPADSIGGTIVGTVNYRGSWPAADSVQDLRFVALRFVPIDTSDFLQLNRMEVSGRLLYGVAADTFTISDVEPGLFPYSGVARQITENIFSWAPVGLVTANGGILELSSAETLHVLVDVDFAEIPAFPKTAQFTGLRHE